MAKKAKTKTVKAQVTRVKQAKRKTKGARFPWEVRYVDEYENKEFHSCIEEFKTRKEAVAYITRNRDLLAPVIVYIFIPPMEY